ncbi:creatininase family protein [Mycolicibacterium goodii]|uniref:Creatininase family protein n=2 Tax=Mycolicibacterium goodii TaxID=134601 RepID=A0ABS6HUH0_MYCGD|nr:creatininase family protein [Mycolicibacterium goodii]MBU8816631.1 creatininase family protein [Mycolicibacterium goodii]MBU8826337.1 creatininase family protein [Mycolicibacterium goodii]MBU8828778.1 creatininase family protein [Mycolicibacterium goodii]MBU8839710.1 creatininase family protein [Mycolicibacterium goodii]
MRIERMTSGEVAAAIAKGACTAILPLAAVEQHGPHLPLSMDADHADELAIRVARELGDALVLPTVRVGYSPHHLGFSGTLSLRASTLEAVCEDYGAHLADSGFSTLVLFSGHIGNYPVMREFEARLAAKLAPLSVIVFTDSEAILDAWRGAAEPSGYGGRVGGHADIAETSVMLALHPERVRLDRLVPGCQVSTDDAFLTRVLDEGLKAFSPNGILGNPIGAAPVIGHACLDAVTRLITDYVRSRAASVRSSS